MYPKERLGPQVRRFLWFFLAASAAIAIIISRRPETLLSPEFWAEDGAVWYQEAYNFGALHSLLAPHTGYFQSTSRLAAAAAMALPLSWAPALFAAVAVTIQALPALFLLSSRMAHLIPKVWVRALAAFLVLALPNSVEVYANLTNSQHHLALLASLIIVSVPAPSRAWKVFDACVIILAGLSGPLVVLLVPLAVLRWWVQKEPQLLLNAALVCVVSLVQVAAFVSYGAESRMETKLGAGVQQFCALVSGQILMGPLIGQWGYAKLYHWG